MPSNFIGNSSLAYLLKENKARPLSLASADFDEDGMPDLASGFAEPGGRGIIAIHRGNVDALWPYGVAIRDGDPPPFLRNARIFSLPEAPDFLEAGDFDADGHWDVVAARRGGSALWFLPGDGRGGFGEPQRIDLPGAVTALKAGEMNRRDGLTDIAVGVTGDAGARVLVFEHPNGALRGDPETFALSSPAAGLVFQPEGGGMYDLAIAAGEELVVVHGRDRKLSLEDAEQRRVPAARVTHQSFAFTLRALATGSFTSRRPQVAALGDDGRIHILERPATAVPAAPLAIALTGGGMAAARQNASEPDVVPAASAGVEWISRGEIDLPSSVRAAGARGLAAAQVSGSGGNDLIVLDDYTNQVHVVSRSEQSMHVVASLDVTAGAPQAVLPMRLNQHPLSGLVTLTSTQSNPVTTTASPANVFTVTNTNDSGTGSLRQAILSANAATGASSIVFNIPNTDPNRDTKTGAFTIKPTISKVATSTFPAQALMDFQKVTTIDGYTQPGASPNTLPNGDNAVILIEINGSLGQTSPGANGIEVGPLSNGSVVRGLTITGWTTPFLNQSGTSIGAYGINVDTGNVFVEGNFLGTDVTGTTARGNKAGIFDGAGVTNVIGGTTPQARNLISGNSSGGFGDGVLILEGGIGATGDLVEGNFIGTDITGTLAIPGQPGGISNTAPTTIGGTVAGARNVISGNSGDGIFMGNLNSGTTASGVLIQGNFIGTDVTGTKAVTSGSGLADGIDIQSGAGTQTNNTIGGTTPGARNIISGNTGDGIAITAASYGHFVQGNFIGTDVTGTKALGNGLDGFFSGKGSGQVPGGGDTIGGAVAGAGNVISANVQNGVEISGTFLNGSQPLATVIQGNLIGTDASGTVALGNQQNGIFISTGTSISVIGSTDTLPRNVIAFNGAHGVLINAGTAQNNAIRGNSIFSNKGAGVRISSGTNNPVSRNSIYSNSALGIDLAAAGPNANSNCQSNTSGANNLENAPVLTAGTGSNFITATATDPNGNTSEFSNCVMSSGTNFNILGAFNGLPSTKFTIEFFSNDSCDASGFGQGKNFIGLTSVTTASNCSANINTSIDLTKADVSVTLSGPAQWGIGDIFRFTTYTSVVTNNGAIIAHNVTLTDNLPNLLTFGSATSTQGTCSNTGNNVTCNLGTMAVGATATVTITANPITPGTVMNTVNVTATEPDPNTTNNTANVSAPSQYPIAGIDHLDPLAAVTGSSDLTISLIGTGFIAGVTQVTFKGTQLQVTSVTSVPNLTLGSPCQPLQTNSCQIITAVVPASLLTAAGTATVVASNPTPGGGSSSKNFNIVGGCTFQVSPNTMQSFDNGSHALDFSVTAASSGCPWTAFSSAPWIVNESISSSPYRYGTSGVAFNVRPNPGAARTGSVAVAGTTIMVQQAGGFNCNSSIVPFSETFPSAGGSGSFDLLMPSIRCSWNAVSDSSWLTITSNASDASGSTSGLSATVPIGYSVGSNSGSLRSGTITANGASFTVTQAGTGTPPTLTLSRHTLNYGYSGSLITNPQPILVNFTGAPGVAWTASSNQSNITVSPASGNGNGMFQVVVTAGASGVVTVTAPGATASPQTVQVNVHSVTPAAPFGSFDTPLDNTTGVIGAIPVTGWALDNIEVIKVDIWREPVGNEPPGNLLYIGDAVFVIGARPDVEAANPNLPWQFRAGWGYLMLTNFLPNGNGTFKLHAIAHDMAGIQTDLGTRTITVDNAHAMKPFGTIDTPTQGGTASGSQFVNFGWALTQNPGCIPTDGSTLTVYVDGVALPGHPVYNNKRSDIATLFPGLCNSNGAIGFYVIDTTQLTNAVHTIFWIATDNQGHAEGLGSRYFNAFNSGTQAATRDEPVALDDGVQLRRGLDPNSKLETLVPDPDGWFAIDAEELDRIELHLGANAGYSLVNGGRAPLPIGSRLKGGVFYWHLGPGFTSTYSLEYTRPDGSKVQVRLKVRPKAF